jgi:deoxycytidine triphosphate deaminase
MVLSDTKIKERITNETVAKKKLLQEYEEKNIKYCRYELRLGKVVTTQTGEISPNPGKPASAGQALVLKPSEMALLLTKELVHLPSDLCATYGQLNRLSKKGLMILNTSIVEPGYYGPLSAGPPRLRRTSGSAQWL